MCKQCKFIHYKQNKCLVKNIRLDGGLSSVHIFQWLWITVCVCVCINIYLSIYLSIYIYIYIFFFLSFRAAPIAYGSFQARGPIGAAAAGIHHGHSSGGSELHLWPTPQLMAMPHWGRPGIEPTSSRMLVGFVTAEPQQELPIFLFLMTDTHLLWKIKTLEKHNVKSKSSILQSLLILFRLFSVYSVKHIFISNNNVFFFSMKGIILYICPASVPHSFHLAV